MTNPFNNQPDFFKSSGVKSHEDAHSNSDVDADRSALHHTLGTGPMQASPGNHQHADLLADIATIKARHAKDVTDLPLLGANGATPGGSKLTRRGAIVELFIDCDHSVATVANVVLIAIPAAHAPILVPNKYTIAIDVATGSFRGVYIAPDGFKTIFNVAAGNTTRGYFTYIAVP